MPLGESDKMASDDDMDDLCKDLDDTMSPSEKTAPATPLKIESIQDLVKEFE